MVNMCDSWTYEQDEARRRGHELAMLRLRWHEAYAITLDKNTSEYAAARRDGAGTLLSTSAQELQTKIATDDDARPVPPEARLAGRFS
jgi:hypothetical protein